MARGRAIRSVALPGESDVLADVPVWCFVLGIVRTWEVVSVLRKVPRNLGSGVGKVPRFRYAFVWRSSEGSGGTFALGRPVFAAMRLRYGGWDCCEPKRKNCAENMKGLESAH